MFSIILRRSPLALLVAAVVSVIVCLVPPQDKSETFAVQEFGRLPVVANGRVQPFDSLARNSLLQLRGKQTALVAPWESNSEQLSAIQWLLEVLTNPAVADTRPVFRIDNPDLKGLLGLPMDAN